MTGWVQAFIIIAAVAIVVQMAVLVAMFLQLKMSMQEFTRIDQMPVLRQAAGAGRADSGPVFRLHSRPRSVLAT